MYKTENGTKIVIRVKMNSAMPLVNLGVDSFEILNISNGCQKPSWFGSMKKYLHKSKCEK